MTIDNNKPGNNRWIRVIITNLTEAWSYQIDVYSKSVFTAVAVAIQKMNDDNKTADDGRLMEYDAEKCTINIKPFRYNVKGCCNVL